MSQLKSEPPTPAVITGPGLILMADALPTLIQNIARRVAAKPDGIVRSVQVDGNVREKTFVEIWDQSTAITVALQASGIGPGHLVILLVRDTLDYVPAWWACLRAGATAVPLAGVAAELPEDELRIVLARLEKPALLIDGRTPIVDRVVALIPDAPIVDIADATSRDAPETRPEAEYPGLIATSGSTGRVKLVALHTKAWLHRCYSQNYSTRGLDSVVVNVFPFDSLNGYRALFLNFASWTQLPSRVLASRPAMVLDAVARYRASTFQTTNSMAARMSELTADDLQDVDLGCLTHVGLGGEAVTPRVAIDFRDMLMRHGAPTSVLGAGYGTTETSFLLLGVDPSTALLDDAGAMRLGGCAAGNSLRIVDDGGRILNEGDVGHVEVLAPVTMFSHYWGEPIASRECFTADGWWKTGDLGLIEGGSLSLRGRSKQTLIVGGRKFSLNDIEAHLQADPKVLRRSVAFILRDLESATDGLGVAYLPGHGTPRNASAASEAIRSSIIRRYGFSPTLTVEIADEDIPTTPTGKIDRSALSRRFASRAPVSEPTAGLPGDRDAVLHALWSEALDLHGPFDPTATFEALGGDSLRLATLLAGVEKALDVAISLPAFFSDPSFGALRALTHRARQSSGESNSIRWPLAPALHRGILHFIEGWPGERVTEDRLLLGRNLIGTRPPIFCVLNVAQEFINLADALGSNQPLFAFRSAHAVGVYDEDLIQLIALRYVQDILDVAPKGPIFLLGQCQGGTIAIAVAQHLLRRGRHVPLLMLADWAFETSFYPGPVALLYGRDSAMNPKFAHVDPAQAWWRAFAAFETAEVAGAYGCLYDLANISSIAGELTRLCVAALLAPPRVVPARGYAVEIEARMPWSVRPGQTFSLDLTIRNVGELTIDTSVSNVWLGNYWSQDDRALAHRRGARTYLPVIAPGEAAPLRFETVSPTRPGHYVLTLDLVVEGAHWLWAVHNGWQKTVFVA